MLPPVLWYLSTTSSGEHDAVAPSKADDVEGGTGAPAANKAAMLVGELPAAAVGTTTTTSKRALSFNAVISLFGVVLLVWSTYLTIYDIVRRED